MKLEDTRGEYYFYSGKVSDIIRQLGFIGIAVIWTFKIEGGGKQSIPGGLIPIGILILLGLAIDLVQYAAGTIIWDKFNRKMENELEEKKRIMQLEGKATYVPEEEDFTAPSSINNLTKTFFWTKFVLMMAAYICLIVYLIGRIL